MLIQIPTQNCSASVRLLVIYLSDSDYTLYYMLRPHMCDQEKFKHFENRSICFVVFRKTLTEFYTLYFHKRRKEKEEKIGKKFFEEIYFKTFFSYSKFLLQ